MFEVGLSRLKIKRPTNEQCKISVLAWEGSRYCDLSGRRFIYLI